MPAAAGRLVARGAAVVAAPAHPAPPAAGFGTLLPAILLAVSVLLLVFAASPAGASCLPIAATGPKLQTASLRLAQVPSGQTRIGFLGHASFLIETPGGASAVTDFNGVHRPPITPDIVTMNNAHSTHFTDQVDPGIRHVLRGWAPDGGAARHNLLYLDLRVRNVPTNVRSWEGTRANGNSMFVFETADLCIAHLGHLHHLLEPVHLNELGPIDVALVPVDGSYTLDTEGMLQVMGDIRAPLVIPMHYFGQHSLDRFLDRARAESYVVRFHDRADLLVSRASLPASPEILVLPARH